MASLEIAAPNVLGDAALAALAAERGEQFVTHAERRAAFGAFRTLPSPAAPPGRYWKIDLDRLDLSGVRIFSSPDDGVSFELTAAARQAGVVACDLATARTSHGALLNRALYQAVAPSASKFPALTTAFSNSGAFVSIPDGVVLDEPVRISYDATAGLFPRTIILAGARSRCVVVESMSFSASAAGSEFVAGVTEIVAGPEAQIEFAAFQDLSQNALVFMTRRAKIGRGAMVHWAVAELGARVSVSSIESAADDRGAQAKLSGLFFAAGDQAIDVAAEIDHAVGDTSSDTLFKGAAAECGQARFHGNIRIRAHAHGCDAQLRDDALLLSKTAHVDSVPALEIAANDVKAFHGATVGAIDDEQLFYLQSRGIARIDAERMITLGFFEPVVARFPDEVLRTAIRTALENKLGTTAV